MTRMNLTALVATALFGLAVGTVTLVMNVRAADKEIPKPATVEELLGAKDFWSTTSAAAKHEFDEKQIVAEIRELPRKSPKPVIRIRAGKLVCDLDGKWRVAKQIPAELAGKVVGAAFAHLEASLADETVAKFAPEQGFTHYSASTRDNKDEPDSIWILVESVGPNTPNGGLNLRWNFKTGKFDKVEQWGAVRGMNPIPSADKIDPERAKQAPVVLRVRKFSRKLDGHEGPKIEAYEGGAKAPLKFCQLNLLHVLKNEGPEKDLKPGSYLVIKYDDRDAGLPDGEFTAYLVPDHPETYKEGIYEYRFIGGKAFADQKLPGTFKEGISHCEGANQEAARPGGENLPGPRQGGERPTPDTTKSAGGGQGAVDPAARQAVYAKVILSVDKPVTSEYALEPWIEKDLVGRRKADFAAMSDWTDPHYPQWVPNTIPGKANFVAVSDWTRVEEAAAHAHFTTIWDGGQLACAGLARYGKRTADGNLTVTFGGFSPGSVDSQGSLPPKPGSRTVVEVTWGNRKCYVALHVGPPADLAGPRPSGVKLDLASRSTRWSLPGRGETKNLDELLLRVTNRTEDDIWFAQAADLKIIVKDAQGNVLLDLGGQKGEIVPPPLFIKTWAPAIIRFTVTLYRPGDGNSTTLTIREPTAIFHEFQNLVPGAYTIQVVYANRAAKLGPLPLGMKDKQGLSEDTPLWVGEVKTKEVTFEIADNPAAGDAKGAVDAAPQKAIYAKVILPVDKGSIVNSASVRRPSRSRPSSVGS